MRRCWSLTASCDRRRHWSLRRFCSNNDDIVNSASVVFSGRVRRTIADGILMELMELMWLLMEEGKFGVGKFWRCRWRKSGSENNGSDHKGGGGPFIGFWT